MAALILQTCLIFALFALTRALLGPAIGSPTNSDSTSVFGAPGGTDFTLPKPSKDAPQSRTADISSRLLTLNFTVEILLDEVASFSTCDCSPASTTGANADGVTSLRTSVKSLETTVLEQAAAINGIVTSVQTVTGQFEGQDFSSKIGQLNGEIDNMKSSLDGLEQVLSTASQSENAEVENLNTRYSDLASSINAVTQQLSSCTSQCSSVAGSTEDMATGQHHTSLQESLNDLIGRMSTAEEGASAIQEDLEIAQNYLPELQNQVNNAVSSSSSTASSITSLQTAITELESEVEKLRGTVESTAGGIGNTQGEIDAALLSLSSLEAASSGANDFSDALATLTSTLTNLRGDVDATTTKGTDNNADYHVLTTDLSSIQSTLSDLDATSKSSTDSLQALNAQISTLRTDIASLDFSGDVDEIVGDISALVSRMTSVTEDLRATCPYPFTMNYDYNICYYKNDVEYTWYQANIMCQVIGGHRAHLAVIQTMEKLSFFEDLLWWNYGDSYHVGLYTIEYDSWWGAEFGWFGGARDYDFPSERWSPYEPNGSGIMCGSLYDADGWGHKLDDISCDSTLYSVCEIPQE